MCSSCWFRIAGVLAVLLLLRGNGVVLAQESPLTPKQQVELQQLVFLHQQAKKMVADGKPSEAAEMLGEVARRWETTFGVTSELFGIWDSILSAAVAAEDFSLGKATGERTLSVLRKTLGPTHWRTRSAKRLLTDVVILEELSPAQRRELADAEKIIGDSVALDRKGEIGQAIDLALRASSAFERTVGKEHNYYAPSLNVLAALHEKEKAGHPRGRRMDRRKAGRRKGAGI